MIGNTGLGHQPGICRVCKKQIIVVRETYFSGPTIWRRRSSQNGMKRWRALHEGEKISSAQELIKNPPRSVVVRARIALEDRCLARQEETNAEQLSARSR
jgi:hypothetical protein